MVCEGQTAFLLAAETETGHGQPIVLTQRDVRELQLATGAIRAGCGSPPAPRRTWAGRLAGHLVGRRIRQFHPPQQRPADRPDLAPGAASSNPLPGQYLAGRRTHGGRLPPCPGVGRRPGPPYRTRRPFLRRRFPRSLCRSDDLSRGDGERCNRIRAVVELSEGYCRDNTWPSMKRCGSIPHPNSAPYRGNLLLFVRRETSSEE